MAAGDDTYVGIDGCRAGWAAVVMRDAAPPAFHVFDSITSMWTELHHARRILIDMPIGLPDRDHPVRQCDVEARAMLGPRRTSVFSPPCRDAAYAATYPEACRINRAQVGKAFSKQMWHILPKLRAVDSFMRETPGAAGVVRECHPEVCFAAFTGSPMPHNKKKPEGIAERRRALEAIDARLAGLIDHAMATTLRKHVARDDIIDACVCALTAALPTEQLRTLPAEPPRDIKGLAVEMVCASESIDIQRIAPAKTGG